MAADAPREPGTEEFVIVIMKTKLPQLLLAVLLGLASGLALQAAPAAKSEPRADVIFFEREKFTDVRDSYMETPKGRDAILAQIKDYIVDRAKWYVPEGSKLTVTINDIDLAGDFEPERGVVRQGELQSWLLTLKTAAGAPVEGAAITVSGGMPQHDHGLPTSPQATDYLGQGRYRIDGVKFTMSGWWQLHFGISAAAGSDSVVFNVVL